MKGKFKKIVPIISIVVVMISCFAFSASAETIVKPFDDLTSMITQLNSYSIGNWENTSQDVWFDVRMYTFAYPFMGEQLRVTCGFEDSVDQSPIVIPAGYTIQLGCSYTVYTPSNEQVGTANNVENVLNFKGTSGDFVAQSVSRLAKTTSNYVEFVNHWTNNTGQDLRLYSIDLFAEDNYGEWLILTRYVRFRVLSPEQQATDEIVNGWDPDPEKPSGSDKFDDLDDLEQEVEGSTQDGISQGESILNSLSSNLASFSSAFIFVTGLFNLFLGVGWIPTLLEVSLALGLIAFILNIVPSIGRAIDRHRNKKE